MPKVSIIVPNYNHQRYLTERLNSIFNQTFDDFEVIILDDASTDQSKEVLNRFSSHPKVSKILFNEINSGSPFQQWKKGISFAKGELIWIAESDDFANISFLDVLVSKFEEAPEAGLAYCQSCKIDSENNQYGAIDWWTDELDANKWRSDYVNSGQNECEQFLLHKNTIPNASAVLVRKSLLFRALAEMTPMKLSGDWQVWVRILLQSDVVFSSQVLNYFRFHQASVRTNTNWTQRVLEHLEIMKLIRKSATPEITAIRGITYSMVKDAFVFLSKMDWNRLKDLWPTLQIVLKTFSIDSMSFFLVIRDGVRKLFGLRSNP